MKLTLEAPTFFYLVVTSFVFVHAKGSGGGGGGRGGGGRSSSGRGISGISKSRAAVVLGSGAAGYAAYKAHKSLRRDRDRDRDKDAEGVDFDSFEQYQDSEDYKLQQSTSYHASEGIGMSAWALLALILGIIGIGTLGWYCCNVFVPVWSDNRQMRRRSVMGRLKDEVPLQETPSTATPSP